MPIATSAQARRQASGDPLTGDPSFVAGRHIDFAGLSVHVQAPDTQRAEAMARLLDSSDSHPGSSEVRVRWRHAPFSTPRAPSEHPFPGLGLWHDSGGATFTVRHGDLTARGDSSSLVVGGGRAGANEMWLDFRRVFEAGMASVLALREYFMLHGAAIARGDRAYLLLGPTGSGKSTLAWAARSSGWSLLADDQIFVRATADGYTVCGMRKPVAVPGELFEGPPVGARHRERAGRARWEMPASSLAGGWHRVHGLIVPAHAESDDGNIIRRSARELLPVLIGAFPGSGHPPLLRSWLPHAAALSRVGGWEVQLARSAAARLDASARLLDSSIEHA